MSKALSSFRRATALATLRRGRASLSLSPTPIACTSASTMSLHTTPVHGNSHRHRNGYRSGAQIARSRLVGVPADRGGAGIDDLIEPKLVVSRTSNNVAAGYQEWTKGLDTTEMSLALDEFLRRPMIRELSAEQGISNKLFITAFRSFRQYCLSETSNVEPALLIVFSDIAKEGHDVDRLFPYFLSHARKVFPHLEAMDELRMVSDLSHPHNWYPDARMLQRKIIFHAGPTNSGKTYHALKRFSEAKSGIYCGPLKLLAAEVFTRSNELGLKCDMVTGEERRYAIDSHHPSAHLSSTVEMLATAMRVEVAVIDEIQMLRDEQRGWAWTRALLGVAADEVHLCGEVAAIDIVKKLLDPIGEHVEVHTYERKTSLTIGTHGVDRLDNIEPGDCIVCFSKKAIFGITKKLEEIGIKPAVIYGDLPPATKLAQAAKFNDPNDPCNVLVSTDAIGMGLNLNIRRVIFQSCTRTGELLPNYAALQIAGRAGRFGTAYANGVATTLRNEDIGTLRDILAKPVEPITSVGIAPTFEQIETFSFHLPQASFVKLLDLFVSVCSVSDHFFICTVDQMKELAVLIDYIPLPLKVRYTFCTCPMKIENKMSEMAFVKMARRFSSGQCLTWEWLSGIIGWPQLPPINITELMALEKVYEIMDAYLWLSLRFSDMMPDEIEVREATRELDKLICEGIDNFTELLANEQGRPQGKQGSMAKKARERAQTQRDKKELVDSEKVNENTGTAKDLQFPDKRRGRRKIIQEFMRNKETLTKDDVEELKKLIDGLDKNDVNKEEK